jgi:hypothetical protein
MKKIHLIILTDEEVEQLNKQKLLDREIEERGILIGWKAAGVLSPLRNLKNQIVIKYKNTKVMKFEKGNVLLCKINGCYKPSITCDLYLCDSHIKGKDSSYTFCRSEIICTTQACYGYYFGKPLHCQIHSSSDMINVKYKRCKFPGCTTNARFGVLGGIRESCLEHKSFKMKDLTTKKCLIPGCEIRPSFAVKGEKAERCKEHMDTLMINVMAKRCIVDDCDIVPTYGYIKGNPMYCKKHNPGDAYDVNHKKCLFTDCNTRASHGCLFSKMHNHCYIHSTLNEYGESKRFPICNDLTCFNPAIFIDYQDNTLQPIRCINHKLEKDIEMIEKVCSSCFLKIYIPNNKKICAVCGNYRYKIISSKEHNIKIFLQSQNIKFIHDKIVHSDGSAYRPDFLINSLFGKIILECDEFQHRDYHYIKEQNRMKTIYKDIQILSKEDEVLFIRYNPDDYKGLQYDINGRLEYLQILLEHFINLGKLNIKLGVIYLFYDGFDGNSKVEEIVIN